MPTEPQHAFGFLNAREHEGLRLAVAAALGVDTGQIRTAGDLDARLARAVVDAGPVLLALDNAEHVVEALAADIVAWERAAPRCRLLVTSQVRLGLRGERVIEVPPLEPEHAAALFLDRAAAVGAPPVSDEDDVALQHILECLDYLPLSLELAAARTRALSLPATRDRLAGLGAEPEPMAPDAFAAFIDQDIAKWQRVVRERNITLE